MSTENEDSNHESLNTTIKGQNCNNILTNEKIHTSNTYNINSEVQNQENQLPKLNNKARASNTSLNINNFEDEVDENKTIYEINFPLKEEDIKKNANRIKTTKYNIFTFIPLNLWSQFHRFSNIYFLLGALSTLFGYSVVSPVAQIMPLVIVLSVTAIKDAYGDIKRSMEDKKANREPYYILRNNEVKQILCKDIYPGDVIVIQKGDKIPADCLLLSSSNDDGVCYVETSDLDGETNLKKKTSLSELSCIRDLEGFSKIQGKIQCEPPCDSFSSFEGRLYFETVFRPRERDTYSITTGRTTTTITTISREIKKSISNISNMIRGNSAFVKVGSPMPYTSLSLNINQILFRGSVLRNTDCVYLMVIYTGKETRIFRNSMQVGLKMSTLEPQLNRYLIYIFILNFIILLISVLFQLIDSYKIKMHHRYFNHWYLFASGKWNTLTEIIKSILSFFALYTYFVPLSLFVTLEVVRVIQSWFFQWDHAMMGQKEVESDIKSTNDTILNLDNDPNLISSRANSADVTKRRITASRQKLKSRSSLPLLSKLEAIAEQEQQKQQQQQQQQEKQQQHQNLNSNSMNQSKQNLNLNQKLERSNLSLNSYSNSNSKSKQWVPMKVNSLNLGEDLGAIQYIFSDKTGTLTKNLMILTKWCIDGKIFDASNEPSCLHQEVYNFYEARGKNDSRINEEFKDKILEYCRALATCHEVMISFDPKSFKPVYESQSPDETAIVSGLEKAGIRLISRTKDSIVFQLWNNEESHEILLLTEFTSDRKCMTVIVKRETDKGPVYTLYTKGADDIISSRLSTNSAVNNEEVLNNTMKALKLFGKMGYRVLMIAERIIDKETYETFINMYRKAECSLGNRAKNIAKALEYIERDLILLGLTAVEDQLQDNIPETIDYLLNAGIKMWLLTGDQQDTAINIGLSSCLLNNNSNIMILNDKTYSRCEKTLERYIEEMKNNDEWGYPMIKFQKKDKDKDEDYSILYDEKHDKNFNNSKISSSWEKNVLVVNGDALAAIFGSRPVKKDKNRSNSKTQELTKNYNCLTHNINNDSTDDSADMNNEKSNGKKGMVKKRPFLFNIIPFLKKTNSNKIYPEYSNPDNSNSDSKIIKRNEEDNNNSNSNSSSNSINKNNKNSTIKFLNINKIFMKSIDNIRKVLILLRINHGQRDGEKDEKKEEEKNKKKKNNEPYNPKNLTPLQRKFIEVGVRCRTVICCRVTPIQKANVVKAVRHNLNAVTLAIGDGPMMLP
ncbi:phospholipid-translocating P-type ATPase [Neocallimastix californiae]|uniref:Phospholipid-translocating P-type ATPase n=1 Tax=Neocallimastix californiae TaxID=1754190 RepID=A0A1Y2E329_9FUNG|nr:phospholipid-translocating P-type ATPase [Neocallimastix californiae]|eukprot:ORY65726.1 phospholipid-translocating P-type ATPase [Neocallimastix californiae]